MAACKECIHNEMCFYPHADNTEACEDFKDRDRFIELPCEVGQTVYDIDYILDGCIVEDNILKISVFIEHDKKIQFETMLYKMRAIEQIGKTVFFTRAEAEEALKECEQNDT